MRTQGTKFMTINNELVQYEVALPPSGWDKIFIGLRKAGQREKNYKGIAGSQSKDPATLLGVKGDRLLIPATLD